MAGVSNPLFLALGLLAVPAIYIMITKSGKYSKLISGSRTLIVLLLIVAAASPYVNAETNFMQNAEITVLTDNSNSAQLMEETNLEFQDLKKSEKVIASGNSSDLKSGLLRNLKQNSAYLVKSDMQSSEELAGIAKQFNQKNASLNVLRTEMKEDSSVSISGPDTTVPGAETQYTVTVHSTSDQAPEPQVIMDDSEVSLNSVDENTWSFTKTFEEKGSHRIAARISRNDHYSVNNQYYKAVEVTEKPEILVIGSRGALGNKISKFYDITYENNVPNNLDNYYSVILMKNVESQALQEYVIEGNGLVYTGDPPQNDNEEMMDILPVKKVDRDGETNAVQTVISIDISEGAQQTGAVSESQVIAYGIVGSLQINNEVGVIAYTGDANEEQVYEVNKPVPLSRNREMLKNKISRIQPGGLSYHQYGILGAEEMLNGTGNIIWVTDGIIPGDPGTQLYRNIRSATLNAASNTDLELLVIGVGNQTNRDFLQEVASRSGGQYFSGESIKRGATPRLVAGGATGEEKPLVIVRPNHFITQNLQLQSTASSFDQVTPKSGSSLLVTETGGSPVLTTWRYGLGRVAAFSADDKQLSSVTSSDPLLVSRTVSWSVGNPKRKQDEWLRVNSTRMPESVEARANYRIDGFRREGDNLYTRNFEPEKLGFHKIKDTVYAYNYPEEYQQIGYNNEMKEIVQKTGGKVYTPDQKKQIKNDIRSFSQRKTVTKKSLSNYLILAAMIIFLSEVGYRKVNGKK